MQSALYTLSVLSVEGEVTSDPAHFPPRLAEFCRAPHLVMAPLDVQAPSVIQSLPNFQMPKCLWDEYAALHAFIV